MTMHVIQKNDAFGAEAKYVTTVVPFLCDHRLLPGWSGHVIKKDGLSSKEYLYLNVKTRTRLNLAVSQQGQLLDRGVT